MLFYVTWHILKRVSGRVAYISQLLKVKSSITYCIWILDHWHLWLMLRSIQSQMWDIPTYCLWLPKVWKMMYKKIKWQCYRLLSRSWLSTKKSLAAILEDKWCSTVLAFVLQVDDYHLRGSFICRCLLNVFHHHLIQELWPMDVFYLLKSVCISLDATISPKVVDFNRFSVSSKSLKWHSIAIFQVGS